MNGKLWGQMTLITLQLIAKWRATTSILSMRECNPIKCNKKSTQNSPLLRVNNGHSLSCATCSWQMKKIVSVIPSGVVFYQFSATSTTMANVPVWCGLRRWGRVLLFLSSWPRCTSSPTSWRGTTRQELMHRFRPLVFCFLICGSALLKTTFPSIHPSRNTLFLWCGTHHQLFLSVLLQTNLVT